MIIMLSHLGFTYVILDVTIHFPNKVMPEAFTFLAKKVIRDPGNLGPNFSFRFEDLIVRTNDIGTIILS